MKKFSKDKRSDWDYWFAHWCAFQMTALTLGIWKFRYIFHDWYKPWMKMFGVPYHRIQWYHKRNSNHHIERFMIDYNPDVMDWDAMIIDWECSQYTKEACPWGAYGEMTNIVNKNIDNEYLVYCLKEYIYPRLVELNLIENEQ